VSEGPLLGSALRTLAPPPHDSQPPARGGECLSAFGGSAYLIGAFEVFVNNQLMPRMKARKPEWLLALLAKAARPRSRTVAVCAILVAPCLARNWDISAGGRTYTFHLRTDAEFHKPFMRPFTAADAKYSLERVFGPEMKSPYLPDQLKDIVGARAVLAGRRRDLEGVKALDTHTLAITLERPRGYFLVELSSCWVSVSPILTICLPCSFEPV